MSHSEHLLKSPANARRLLRSIAEADAGQLEEHELINQAGPRQIDFDRILAEVMLRFRKTLAYLAQ